MEDLTTITETNLVASTHVAPIVGKINEFILNPIIGFLFGLALVLFLWGVAEYLWQSDSDSARRDGSMHMIWGILGMFIMFAAFAIIRIIANTIGADIPTSIG